VISEADVYTAMESRDPRFDGWFFVAVVTTGIYCRPSCAAAMPKRENIRLFPSPAAAQTHGFRACKRCMPDAAPGSPQWNTRADLAGRAMRLIADGVIDREGVTGLAARLGYSERQVHRQLIAEVGASPQALARAQRAQTARMLLETTDLPVSDVAFAAGFASIRQFNDTVKQVYGATPTAVRAARADSSVAQTPGSISLKLAYRPPLDATALLNFLGAHAIPGIEEYTAETLQRSCTLPHGPAIITLQSGRGDHIECQIRLTDLRDLTTAVQRCRRWLDLDADMQSVIAHLGADPLLGPLIRARPGRRLPAHIDAAELAIATILGDGPALTDLVRRHGHPLATPIGGITHTFPDVDTLSIAQLNDLDTPPPRRRTLIALIRALADGTLDLDPGADRDQVRKQLRDIPGISPQTVAQIRMRALGDPDIIVPDRRVRQALSMIGRVVPDDADSEAPTRQWAPWRSYATQHLWALHDTERHHRRYRPEQRRLRTYR